jgi:PUA domain protein
MKGIATLSKRDARAVLSKIEETWPFKVTISSSLKEAKVDQRRRILIFDGWMAVQLDDDIVPFLGSYDLLERFPAVVVDAGAVPHICNGADVMRPGILEAEGSFGKGCIICVRENRYQKNIASGITLLSKDEALAAKKGAIVKNVHYVGDIFWNSAKSIRI